MSYAVWTDKDLEKYKSYVSNISFEQLGRISISGIFHKTDLTKPLCATGFLFRVYDRNVNAPDRTLRIHNPGSVNCTNGTCKGVVVAVARDSATGSFVQMADTDIANPAAIWIRRHYTGNIRVIAEQVVGGHEKRLHEEYCTCRDGRTITPVLTEEHVDLYILPPAIRGLAEEITRADARNF